MIFFPPEESVPKLSQMNKIAANKLLIQIPMNWGNMTLFFSKLKSNEYKNTFKQTSLWKLGNKLKRFSCLKCTMKVQNTIYKYKF